MIVSLVVNLPCIYHENLASLAIDTPMFIGVYAVLTQEQRIFGYPSGIWILYSFVLFYCPHCQIFIGFYLHILAKLNQGFKLFSSPFVVEVIPPCQLMLHQFTGTFLILRVLIRVTPYIIYAYMFIYIYIQYLYIILWITMAYSHFLGTLLRLIVICSLLQRGSASTCEASRPTATNCIRKKLFKRWCGLCNGEKLEELMEFLG